MTSTFCNFKIEKKITTKLKNENASIIIRFHSVCLFFIERKNENGAVTNHEILNWNSIIKFIPSLCPLLFVLFVSRAHFMSNVTLLFHMEFLSSALKLKHYAEMPLNHKRNANYRAIKIDLCSRRWLLPREAEIHSAQRIRHMHSADSRSKKWQIVTHSILNYKTNKKCSLLNKHTHTHTRIAKNQNRFKHPTLE